MADREFRSTGEPNPRLREALREVRTTNADRDDVVVELREASRMRLELLAQELEPVFKDIADDDLRFDFAISSGLQPRLWIDAVAHVGLGRDRRTYRFVQDTRKGRIVLCESPQAEKIADAVTRYVAERVIERQRWIDGEPEIVLRPAARSGANEFPGGVLAAVQALHPLLKGIAYVAIGALIGLFVVAIFYWRAIFAYLATA